MNAPLPSLAFSDAVPAEIIPPEASDYADAQWIGSYNGQNIFRLPSCGLYWNMETGCFPTVAEAREAIDRWWDTREVPGFGNWSPSRG